ncbi:hypothetical protein Goarm_004978 [Gossypium armourianum]|uniref:Uncharacterized protein n=1 Tax=Gossypium armourianum TaxID=34283 RepID=A0A7J9JYN1_9ROSI|nr:hypothetical protein [Gossypium armourianum]
MIRNIDVDILKSIIYKNKHIPTAFVVEALTYVQVVRFGAEFGFIRVEIEGDALSINLNMVGPSVVVTVDANDRNGVTEGSRVFRT